MKQLLLLLTVLISMQNAQAQTWTKISTNFDSLWSTSVKYYNHGDTIIYYGGVNGSGQFSPQRFYISTDGGYTFQNENTDLRRISVNFNSLPINNLLIGYQDIPNLGSYRFNGINNWTSIFPQATDMWGEINNGTVFCGKYVFSTTNFSSSIGQISSWPNNMRCYIVSGNRVLLGGDNVQYFDNGNYTSVSTSTFTPMMAAGGATRFFISNNTLYCTGGSPEKLYKSTDNGATFTTVNTTYNSNTLVSSFIIGTPNGNIFFLETSTGTSDNVFLSTDGGLTATKISQGLPSNGMLITPTIGKLLVSKNKVWYQICAANTVDFVRTDTTIAGLYLFNSGVTDVNEQLSSDYLISIYPNPTKDLLIINTNLSISNYQITNSLGQVTKSDKFNNQPIDISKLENGIYFIRIMTSDNKTILQKIIKD